MKNEKHEGTLVGLIKGLPHKRIIALILTLSLSFSLISTPVLATSDDNPSVAAKKLVDTLQSILSGETEYENEAQPEDTEETDTDTEESYPVSQSIVAMTIKTPEETMSFKADEAGNPVLTSTVPAKAPAEAEGAASDDTVIWSDFDTKVIVPTGDGWDKDCILYFLLNNDSSVSKAFKKKDGSVQIFHGINNYAVYKDADNNLICDDCGRCIGGCTGDEAEYTEADRVKTEGGYAYNAEGVVIGREVTTTVSYKTVDSSGKETVTTETNTGISFYSYSVDADGKCNVCGSPICSGPMENYAHDFSDGKCDLCGGEMSGCVDVKGTKTDEGETGNGKCDNCGKKMSEYNACPQHYDKYGETNCNNCKSKDEEKSKHCNHMTDAEVMMALKLLSGMYTYLGTVSDKPTGTFFNLIMNLLGGLSVDSTLIPEDMQVDKTMTVKNVYQLRSDIKTAVAYDNSYKSYISDLESLDASKLTAKSLIGTLDSNGEIDSSASYLGQLLSRYEEYAAQYEAANDTVKSYYKHYDEVKTKDTSILKKYAEAMLDKELKSVFGDNLSLRSSGVNNDNKELLYQKARAVDEVLPAFLYGTEYKTNEIIQEAKNVWVGKTQLTSETPRRSCVLFQMLSSVVTSTMALDELPFTNNVGYVKQSYDDLGKSAYAVRTGMEEDIAKHIDSEYEVYDEQIQSVIKSLDAFLNSDEGIKLITVVAEQFIGKITDQDGGGISLYDIIVSLLINKVLSDGTLSKLLSNAFSLMDSIADELPSYLSKLQGVEGSTGSDKVVIDVYDFIGGNLIGVGSWLSVILDALGETMKCTVKFDGNGESNSLKTVLGKAGICLYPDQVADCVTKAACNADGKYNPLAAQLSQATSWKDVGELHFDIETVEEAREIVTILLDCFKPIINIAMSSGSTTDLYLNKAAVIAINGTINIFYKWITIPVFINIKGNFKLSVEGMDMYYRVLVPIFEALGIDDFDLFKCGIDKNSLSGGVSTQKLVSMIFDPIDLLLHKISEKPLETILSVLPNIAQYMSTGKLLQLLNFNTDYSMHGYQLSPSATQLKDNFVDMIFDMIFDDKWDYINPVKWAQFAIAVAAYWPVSAIFMGVVGIFEAADPDFTDFMGWFSVDISAVVTALADGAFDKLPGIIEPAVNEVLKEFNISFKLPKMKWPTGYKLMTDGPELSNLNFYKYLKACLSGDTAKKALGFDINDPVSIFIFVLDCLYDSEGSKLFDTSSLNKLSTDKLAHLGTMTVRNDSIRSSSYYSNWVGLDKSKGEYYFVEADTSDVFYWLIDAVCALLGSEQNIKGVLTILGLNDTAVDELLNTIEDIITEATGLSLDLKAMLSDFFDENGKLTLNSVCKNMTPNNLLCVLTELVLSDSEYELAEIIYAEVTEDRAQNIEDRGNIPAQDYNNIWNRSLAGLLSDDLDDLVNTLINALGLDLVEDTEGVESVQQFAESIINNISSESGLLDILTQIIIGITEPIAVDAKVNEILKLAAGIDFTAWSNDFGFLFDDEKAAPEQKSFERLSAEKTEDGTVWILDGNIIDSEKELLSAVALLLSPLEDILDSLLCGKDLELMRYTTENHPFPTGRLISVKGGQGYNQVVLPMLEAILGEDNEGILSAEDFNKSGSTEGLMYCVELLLNYVRDDILKSETPVGDLMEMIAQLLYLVSDDGLTNVVKELIRPVTELLDIVRPIANIDIDTALNSVVCQLTYKLGGFESADEELKLMKSLNAGLSLKTISLEQIAKMLGVVLSAEKDGERVLFNAADIMDSALNDLAYLRTSYTSKSVLCEGNSLTSGNITAYRLNISGMDSMSVILSMFAEILLYSDNAYVLDNALGLKGLLIALQELLAVEAEYTTDFDWAYFAGDENAKAELIKNAKEKGFVSAEDYQTDSYKNSFNTYLESYRLTDWDYDTSRALITELDDVISGLMNIETGSGRLIELVLPEECLKMHGNRYTLGSVIEGITAALTKDENIDKLLYKLSELLDTLSDSEQLNELISKLGLEPEKAELLSNVVSELMPYLIRLTGAVGIDLQRYMLDPEKTVYENGTVIYYGKDGKPSGISRECVKEDMSNLGNILADILSPFEDILSFALIGKPLSMFSASSELINGRGEAIINIPGFEGYDLIAVPLLEMVGSTGLKPADYYINGGDYRSEELLDDLFGAVVERISYVLSDADSTQVLDKLVDMLPALMYFVNANGIGVIAQNILAPIERIADMYNSVMLILGSEDSVITLEPIKAMLSELGLGDMLRILFAWVAIDGDDLIGTAAGSVLSAITQVLNGADALEVQSEKGEHLVLSDFFYEIFNNYSTGRIVYNADSAASFESFTMRFTSDSEKADFLTVFISAVMDIIEAPENESALRELLGDSVYQSVINVFNLSAFEFTPFDINWQLKDYADTGKLVTAFELSDKLRAEPLYGKLWTPEKAQELASDLDGFLEDTLYLLGLSINGVKIREFKDLSNALLCGVLYNAETLNAITKLLGNVKPLLDKYDPDGAIADFVLSVLDIDLHAWDDYAPGGKYENGRDWGLVTAYPTTENRNNNAEAFEAAISELLAPIAPLLTFVMAGRDFTFFVDGDGLGANAEKIQLTIVGAEGYKYGIVPLLEAIGTDDITNPDEYSRLACENNEYAIKGIIHPIISKLNEIADNTFQEFFELIPEIVYFLNSGGFGNMIENLLHSVYVIGNALEPINDEVELFVYDEQGIFDLYNTLDLTANIDKLLFDAFGIEKADLIRLYNGTGGNYSEVDSFEDIDLRLILAVVLAMADSILGDYGFDTLLMPVAVVLVDELSYGYLKSFDSLTGREAYKMEFKQDMSSQALGDLFTLLMRALLCFMAEGNNVDCIMELIGIDADMDPIDRLAVRTLLGVIAVTLADEHSIEGAMMVVYYSVHGARTVSGLSVQSYSKLNTKWAALITKLNTKNDGYAGMVMQALMDIGGDKLDDVIDSHQIAPNGFVAFFLDSLSFFSSFLTSIRSTFLRIFSVFRF